MKKTYYKPRVYIEQFSLSANIAGDCGVGSNNGNIFGTPGFSSPMDCAWLYGGMVVAYCSTDVCGDKCVENESDFMGYCYNSGADDVRIFSS